MIAVDTNVIVRLLTQDDEVQYQKSLEIIQNNNVFIPDTVVLETEWVLRFAYKFKPLDICSALGMLSTSNKQSTKEDFKIGEFHGELNNDNF